MGSEKEQEYDTSVLWNMSASRYISQLLKCLVWGKLFLNVQTLLGSKEKNISLHFLNIVSRDSIVFFTDSTEHNVIKIVQISSHLSQLVVC